MPARIDDFRVWQDHPDQADVAKVVRHLVDEKRCACTMDHRVANECLTELTKLVLVYNLQHLRITAGFTFTSATAQALRERQDIG